MLTIMAVTIVGMEVFPDHSGWWVAYATIALTAHIFKLLKDVK